MQTGDLIGGLPLLEQALVYDPVLAFAHTNRASALASLGRHEEALAAYANLPDSAEKLSCQGTILAQLQRYDEAVTRYQAALTLAPEEASYHHDLGAVLALLKRHEEALASYTEALRLRPAYASALRHQGRLYHELKRYEEAVISYNASLALDTSDPNAFAGLCASLMELKRYTEALALVDEALVLHPLKMLLLYKAVILYHLFDYGAALATADQALAMDTSAADSWSHRGYILMAMRRHAEARACYDQALLLNPEGNDENWAHALLTLTTGDFLSGWPLYEWRWNREEGKGYRDSWPQAPKWLGDWSLQGKTLLVLCEQGMGDTLQFCRFIPPLLKLGAKVKLVVQKPLVKLLAASLPSEVLVTEGAGGVGNFDFFTPLLSLPLALKTTMHTIPCQPYLKANTRLMRHWQRQLGIATRPRIGLAWSGNPNPKSDHKRTIPLVTLEPLLTQDADFYVLQRDLRPEDDLTAFPNLHLLPEALNGFDQTAALAMNMDHIITIDTSITHLVGGLGLPTTVLLPYHACFRWLTDRDDSPWYPAMHLLRQPAPGQWDPVVAEAKLNLLPSMSGSN